MSDISEDMEDMEDGDDDLSIATSDDEFWPHQKLPELPDAYIDKAHGRRYDRKHIDHVDEVS